MTAQEHRHPRRRAIRRVEAIRRLCVHNGEAQEHALGHCRWCPSSCSRIWAAWRLLAATILGSCSSRDLLIRLVPRSSYYWAEMGLTDFMSPLGVPRPTTGRNPVRFMTAPAAHRLRARGAPCAGQQGRPPPCVGGRNSSDCQRELGRGAGRAKVSNELSNYCSANRQPHRDDPGSFGAPGIGIADRLACFTPKQSETYAWFLRIAWRTLL